MALKTYITLQEHPQFSRRAFVAGASALAAAPLLDACTADQFRTSADIGSKFVLAAVEWFRRAAGFDGSAGKAAGQVALNNIAKPIPVEGPFQAHLIAETRPGVIEQVMRQLNEFPIQLTDRGLQLIDGLTHVHTAEAYASPIPPNYQRVFETRYSDSLRRGSYIIAYQTGLGLFDRTPSTMKINQVLV